MAALRLKIKGKCLLPGKQENITYLSYLNILPQISVGNCHKLAWVGLPQKRLKSGRIRRIKKSLIHMCFPIISGVLPGAFRRKAWFHVFAPKQPIRKERTHMAKNDNLHKAKTNAADEFFTQYQDISNECSHYREHFKGKTVYCNCDDPAWSNFWKYFHNNFASFGLKKLISTHYQKGSDPSYAMIYEGGDDFNMEAGKTIEIKGNRYDIDEEEKGFYTAGDFRSNACIGFLKEAGIVCTNPPFSLFREYVGQLIKYGKKFIIIGNQNAVTYKEIFPLIKDNKLWLGYGFKGGAGHFINKYYKDYAAASDHKEGMIRVSGVTWFTNLNITKRHDGLWHVNGKFDNSQAHNYYEGHEDKYPKYDNYDAINVDKTKDIPIDYEGVMGVPITWLDKYSPDEFELVGCTESEGKGFSNGLWDSSSAVAQPLVNGERKYKRIFIKNKQPVKKRDDLGY